MVFKVGVFFIPTQIKACNNQSFNRRYLYFFVNNKKFNYKNFYNHRNKNQWGNLNAFCNALIKFLYLDIDFHRSFLASS